MTQNDFPAALVPLAKQHISFLEAMHKRGVSLEDPVTKHAPCRYVDFWLPLVVKMRTESRTSARYRMVVALPPSCSAALREILC